MKIVIADDELLARQRLERLVGALDGMQIVALAANGADALAAIREHTPDVVLLDVRMPDLSGIEVAGLIDRDVAIVFVTAYAEHAVEAFGVEAVDYLLKPVDAARLRSALERAGKRTRATAPRLPVKTQRGLVLIDPSDITHVSLDGELVHIHTATRSLISDWSLNALEARLPDRFMRVSRQALLNLDHVELLEPTDSGGYLAKTRSGALVQVSRQAARDLRRSLGL